MSLDLGGIPLGGQILAGVFMNDDDTKDLDNATSGWLGWTWNSEGGIIVNREYECQVIETPKCECGAEKLGYKKGRSHSHWCPFFKE